MRNILKIFVFKLYRIYQKFSKNNFKILHKIKNLKNYWKKISLYAALLPWHCVATSHPYYLACHNGNSSMCEYVWLPFTSIAFFVTLQFSDLGPYIAILKTFHIKNKFFKRTKIEKNVKKIDFQILMDITSRGTKLYIFYNIRMLNCGFYIMYKR